MITYFKCTFGLKEDKEYKRDAKAKMPSQRGQYESTVHLFIGMGHSPNKITFMSLITNHNHDTNYQGLCGLFLFKSVPPFVSSVSSCRSSFNCSFGIYFHIVSACISSYRRCFCLEDLQRRRRPPTVRT